MAKVNAKLLKIYTGGTPASIDCLVEASISLSREVIDTSCKDDTTGFGSSIVGDASGTLSGSGYVIDNGTNNHEELFTAFKNKTAITWKLSAETAGTSFKSGNGWITSYEETGSVNEAIKFSFTITINGEVTQTPIA